ncbi:MAG: hypothetical protein K6G11_01995 [Lachnospiraceae bacterium]|nr:hypothetical protein [Lachnospiraceae bacterium]
MLDYKNKIMAFVLISIIVITSMVSEFFIAEEFEHDCCGEDCPVCSVLECCDNIIHRLWDGGIIFFFCIFLAFVATVKILPFICKFERKTLVSVKVRLDN